MKKSFELNILHFRENILIMFFVFSLKHALFAQASPFAVEDYPFVNNRFNKIELPGPGEKYKKFYEKTERMLTSGQGQINIVHFGGSHIQADIWSNRTRNHLQNLMPGASGPRGFLFPFKVAKTNNPYHYQVEYTGNWESCRNAEKNEDCLLGVSGIAVTTNDTLSSIKIMFREDQPVSYYHTRIRIFHHLTDSSYDIFPVNASAYTKWEDTVSGFTGSEKRKRIRTILPCLGSVLKMTDRVLLIPL
jgi:hypothetical protein